MVHTENVFLIIGVVVITVFSFRNSCAGPTQVKRIRNAFLWDSTWPKLL